MQACSLSHRKNVGKQLLMAFSVATVAHLAISSSPAFAQQSTGFQIKTGSYTCELGRSIEVKRVADDHSSVVVRHDNKDYTLKSIDTSSGALRFEDAKNGRAWVVIVGNSMFLDAKRGQRLANACVAT